MVLAIELVLVFADSATCENNERHCVQVTMKWHYPTQRIAAEYHDFAYTASERVRDAECRFDIGKKKVPRFVADRTVPIPDGCTSSFTEYRMSYRLRMVLPVVHLAKYAV